MTRLPEALVPPIHATSNRRIVERLQEWGCDVLKTQGEWTRVVTPWGDTFRVRSAQSHSRNGMDVIGQMLNLMGMSWEAFMGTDLSPISDDELWAIREATDDGKAFVESLQARLVDTEAKKLLAESQKIADREAERIRREQRKAKAAKAREEREMAARQQKAALSAVSDMSGDEKASRQELDQEPTPVRQRIINQVLDMLIECGEPMSIDRLLNAFEGEQPRRGTVQGACLRLLDQGVVNRIKPGVYQAKAQHQRQDVRVGVQGAIQGGVGASVTPAVPGPQKAVQRINPLDLTDADETVNDVLDLMFPNGFKARHLPLIDAWRQATVALMQEIEHESDS